MHGPPDDHKEKRPDLVEQDEASGIEALPKRVGRYGDAKRRALEVVEYIEGLSDAPEWAWRAGAQVAKCGEYFLFRHYWTIDEVRLHAARFCKKHLLCPLCAIRRGAKALGAYLPRYDAVRLQRPLLRPFLVTLTVKDGPDLRERFAHLKDSQHELWKRRQRGRGSVLDGVEAAVWSYEVKRGRGSGLWHPHLHMVALAEQAPDAARLRDEWHAVTCDSYIVDVRPIDQADPASGFAEVFKYAVKFSDMELADTVHAFRALSRSRLVASAGLFRGIEIPEQLTDEPLDNLPFVQLLYRYLGGRYALARQSSGEA
jgi:hypothetical protein